MIYLLGTTLGALRLSYGPCVMIAVLNTFAFDFLFVPPLFAITVDDLTYLVTLGVMLLVALVIVTLMSRIRNQRERANARERRIAALYAMSRELAAAGDAQTMIDVAIRHIRVQFDSDAVVLLADGAERVPSPCTEPGADMVHQLGGQGVLIVRRSTPAAEVRAEQMNLLDAFVTQLASALQRSHLAEAAEAARISAEQIRLRNTLLASISHDLRTPLAALAGAGGLLAQPECNLNADHRISLGRLVERKALDMTQLLTNVLELARLEFGSVELRTEWHAIEEMVALALRTSSRSIEPRRIDLRFPSGLPFVRVEATLIVKLFSNLLENAGKYTPPSTTITISAEARAADFLVVIEDDGPGLPPGRTERLFDKFQRGNAEGAIAGVGLGLAICRAAARLHGGDIIAVANSGGGARFEITLPLDPRS